MTTNTSTAQALANRANATLSTGPRTEHGKANSGQNAVTHGATSRRLLFGPETQVQFDTFRDSVFQHHQPCGEYENLLTDKVAITAWRHHRLLRIESEYYSRVTGHTLAEEVESDALALTAFFVDEETERFMRTMPRYVGGAAREWKHAMSALETIQKERRARENAAASADPVIEDTAGAAAQPEAVPDTAIPALPASLTRPERRAIERARRKAALRSGRSGIGFVSQAA